MCGEKTAGGIGRGIFEGEVFESVLGLFDDSTLYDTLQALCENQVINAAGHDSVSGSDAETFWFDLDKDGTTDFGITVKSDEFWNQTNTPAARPMVFACVEAQ